MTFAVDRNCRCLSVPDEPIRRALDRVPPEWIPRRRRGERHLPTVQRHTRSQPTLYAARARHPANAIERLCLYTCRVTRRRSRLKRLWTWA